jgi:hypothetical protein
LKYFRLFPAQMLTTGVFFDIFHCVSLYSGYGIKFRKNQALRQRSSVKNGLKLMESGEASEVKHGR